LERKNEIEWSKWHVFFADERFVALDDAESNYRACKEQLFDALEDVAIDLKIYPIDTKAQDVKKAAELYSSSIRSVFGLDDSSSSTTELPKFDLILLGMGPDGHTASLFPNHNLLTDAKIQQNLIAFIEDSPKPPPQRITFTLPLINAAHSALFVVSGAAKLPVVKKLIDPNEVPNAELPSSLVRADETVIILAPDVSPENLAKL